MEVPLLPVNGTAVQLEGHTFRLGYVYWLEVVSEANLSLNELVIEVGRRRCVEWPALFGHINVDDLLCLNVEDGAKVEWVGVLEVVDAGSVVHNSLLESGAIGIALVVSFRGGQYMSLYSCINGSIPMVQGSQ